MSLFNKPLNEVTIDDIDELVSNGVGESRVLDYKLELHGNGDSGKKELLKDLSAFANTVGGCLIYGIEEEGGLPKAIIGVEIADFDKFKLHYENLLRTGVAPAIRGVEFHSVPIGSNKCIVLIEVPKSISRPHAVTIKKHFNFYSRNSSGTNALEVEDLRRVFLASETTAMRIRNFRNDRIAEIASGQTYLPLADGAKMLLHLIPFNLFEVGLKYNWLRANHEDFPPFLTFSEPHESRLNFDGLITYYRDDNNNLCTSTQVSRNGVIEGIDSLTLQQGEANQIDINAFEIRVVQALERYLASLKKFEIVFPVWACITLINVKGFLLNRPSGGRLVVFQGHPIDHNELLLPEIQIENSDIPGEDVLKPAFDLIWNASGYERSMNYDADGNWQLNKGE